MVVMEAEKIEEIAKAAAPKITVVGIGGAGCNIVTWMKDKGVGGAQVIAINTDAQHLAITKADRKLLVGYKLTRGLGCGGFPERGAEALKEDIDAVKSILEGTNLVFVLVGLGGGTGTGGAPIVSKLARDMGALAIAVATLPFMIERARWEIAKKGLKSLVSNSDAVIVIDNERLRKVAGGLPLYEAFNTANELIATFVKSISETIALPSLVNMDFADLRSIMQDRGICAIGVGEATGDNRVERAVEMALNYQLLDIKDISKATGALIHVEGGQDLTLEEVNRAGELVLKRISPHARVSWGARIDRSKTDYVRVTVVLTGAESPFLIEELGPKEEEKPVEVEEKKRGLFGKMFKS